MFAALNLTGLTFMTKIKMSLPILAMLLLGACNTVVGAGEDLSRAGVVIQQEARAAQ